MRAGHARPPTCPATGVVFVGVSPLINAWPAPTPGAPDFGGIAEAFNNPLQTIRDDFGTMRLDHVFSPKDWLSGVYTIDDSSGFHTDLDQFVHVRRRDAARTGGEPEPDACVFADGGEHGDVRVFAREVFLYGRTDAWNSGGEPSGIPERRSAGRAECGRERVVESGCGDRAGGREQWQQSARGAQHLSPTKMACP